MSVRRSAYFSFGTRNAGVLINFVATLVIARLLTPDEIGVFAVSAAFVMISQIIRDSGIGSYIIQERDLTRENLRTAMGVSLLIGAMLGGMIFVLAEPLARFYAEPGVEDVLLILVFSFVLAPVNAVGLALLRRDLAFGTAFWIETTSNLVWSSVAVALAYGGYSYHSMAWASVAATSTICLLFVIVRRELILIRPSLKQWRRVFRFGSIVTLTQLLSQVGVLAPALVLGRVADFSAVAFYNRGNSLTRMFRDTVERGAAVVALPAFSAELRRGAFNKPGYCYATALMTGISWPFFGLIAILAYPIVRILFGDQWDAAVPVVQLLAIAHMIRGPVALAPELTTAQGAVRLGLLREIIVQSARVVIIVLCAFHGVVAVAAGQIAATLLALIVNQTIVNRLVGLTAGELAEACLRSVAVAVATAVGPILVVVFLPPTPTFLWEPLLLGLATGGLGWLVGIAVTGHPLRGEMSIVFRKSRAVLSPRRA
ncbi:lipopolysaccharide biosynthesis protein [Thalassobaculum sp.]|uniref:lipopolysaccharide biosynthesis protein n=1 Tax=Thalassobaculum sp. TaxID=2022740 RepID=UPI0032ED0BC9